MAYRKGDRVQFTLGRGCVSPVLTGEVVEDVPADSSTAHVLWDCDTEPTTEFLVFLQRGNARQASRPLCSQCDVSHDAADCPHRAVTGPTNVTGPMPGPRGVPPRDYDTEWDRDKGRWW